MRRYYDAQGNQTGTSTSTAGRIGAGCLGLVCLFLLIAIVVGLFSH